MRVVLLIMIGLSILNAEITRDSNGIVTDTSTNLQWQDDAVDYSRTWEAALNYCESLPLGGYSDWRLPNINELKSIVDRSKEIPAIVDGFVNTNSDNYWSSTSKRGIESNAKTVSFYFGVIAYSTKFSSFVYVRCVRDGE